MTNQVLVVHSDPEILGGTPVFVGTRVPLRNLIDYLERGHTLDECLDVFPSVSQVVAALEAAHEALTAVRALLDEQTAATAGARTPGPRSSHGPAAGLKSYPSRTREAVQAAIAYAADLARERIVPMPA